MTFEQIKQMAEAKWDALHQQGGALVFVGAGTCGRNAGAMEVIGRLSEEIKKNNVDATIVEVGCMGWCDVEPLVMVAKSGSPRVFYGNVTPDSAGRLVTEHLIGGSVPSDLALCTTGDILIDGTPRMIDFPFFKNQERVLLRNCGSIHPEKINYYIACGGYSGFSRALNLDTDAIISEIRASGLRGRGGAGFSTAEKLLACCDTSSTEKYVICNASEGDPAAIKDRCLLEGDPHSVIEGLLIAAYTVGASQAYICINPEYELALQRLQTALAQMTNLGLLGENILASGFTLKIDVKRGLGMFVCGEESALISTLGGGLARSNTRPPYPAEKGLNGHPTLVCNVETFANISTILRGSTREKQTKLLTLTGGLKYSGVIEVPMDMSLREIVTETGGGTLNGKPIKAVQIGGPTGAWLASDQLDVAIDYDQLAGAGTILGSGSVLVASEDRCAVDMARSSLDFIHLECCGKCVFGREGTRQLADILRDIAKGDGRANDITLLEELCGAMKIGALCDLGKGAPNSVISTIHHFRSEYEAHIKLKKCPASVCKLVS